MPNQPQRAPRSLSLSLVREKAGMRKRGRSPSRSDTQIAKSHSDCGSDLYEEGRRKESSKQMKGDFFAVYLLCSLCPRFKGHTYIGFTVNPRRRIRQHNGEITSGAWRTKHKRPWEMVLCIFGFPSNVAALQFEWAWQHPRESLAVRDAASKLKSLSGIGGKIKLAYTMLTLPPWQGCNLKVNFFSTKYMKHIIGCPTLPDHVKVQVLPMDELPCYSESWGLDNDVEDDTENENSDDLNNVNCDDSSLNRIVGMCNGGNHPDPEVGVSLKNWSPGVSITKFYRSRKALQTRVLSNKDETNPFEAPSKSTSDEDNHPSPGVSITKFYRSRKALQTRVLSNKDETNPFEAPSKSTSDEDNHPDPEVGVSLKNWSPDVSITNFYRSRKALQTRVLSSKDETNPFEAPSKSTSDEDESCVIISPPKQGFSGETPTSSMTRLCNMNAASELSIIDLTDSPACIQL